MGKIYALCIPVQLMALLYIHLEAGELVGYKKKLKKKNPACAPQNIWDFLTFRYYLRCPKADRAVKKLYIWNLVNIAFLAVLVVLSILLWNNYDLTSNAIVHFWPIAVSIVSIVACRMVSPKETDFKYIFRYWVLPDLVVLLLIGLLKLLGII